MSKRKKMSLPKEVFVAIEDAGDDEFLVANQDAGNFVVYEERRAVGKYVLEGMFVVSRVVKVEPE